VATFPEGLPGVRSPARKCHSKLYPPKRMGRSGWTRLATHLGIFSATVTGHLTQAEGSFDSVSGVRAKAAQTVQTRIRCSSTRSLSPPLLAVPQRQVARDGSSSFTLSGGGGFIQYWLENFGPAGTQCPLARGELFSGHSYSDGVVPIPVLPYRERCTAW